MRKIIYIIFALTALASCRKVLDIDIPEKDRKIVVNSIFAADSAIRVHVSKSISALESDNDVELVHNAQVSLFKDNTLLEVLNYDGKGFYKSDFGLGAGHEYTVQVTVPNMNTAFSSCVLPEPVSIISLDTSFVTIHVTDEMMGGTYDVDAFEAKIRFHDPDGENYYMVSAKVDFTFEYYYGMKETYSYYPYISANDFAIKDNNTYIYFNEISAMVFDDHIFEGQEYTLPVYFEEYNFNEGENNVTFFLHSIPKEFYLYVLSREKYNMTEGGFFAEPVLIYNNITNGYGLFTGYSSDSRNFVVDYVYDYDGGWKK